MSRQLLNTVGALALTLCVASAALAEGEAATVTLRAMDPARARQIALWPGFLLHGAGHRYAGDNEAFYSMVGGELFGVLIGGFGVGELFGPEVKGEHKGTALALAVTGGSMFLGTWLWDIAFAPRAAKKFNDERGLGLWPTLNGAVLVLRF